MTMKLLSIDPGAGGGIAIDTEDGVCDARNMPESMTELCDVLREYRIAGYAHAIVERTGTYMPGNSGPGAATFARHCGHIDAALYCAGIAIHANPTPQQWMKKIGVPNFGKDKASRKRWIKEWAQRRFPYLNVTLKTADALAMMEAMK